MPDSSSPGTNAAPAVVTTGAMAAPSELMVAAEAAATWTVSDWFSDPDTGDTLTYAAMVLEGEAGSQTPAALPPWLVLDATKGEFTIAAAATEDTHVGTYTLVVMATDSDGETVTHTVVLTVEDANSAPTVVTGAMAAPTTVTAMEGGAASWTISDWFTDPDGDSLTFTTSTLPTWLVLNSAMTELSIAANATDDAEVGSHTVEVTATDSGGETVTHTVTVVVSNVAEDPTVVAGAPASLTAMEGSATAMTWDAMAWFSDEDTALPSSPDSLTYTATGLPDWLTLNGATGVLTIAALATDDPDIGMYTLAVTASDKAGAMASHTVTLSITDSANEPFLSAALPNRIAPVTGMPIELDLTNYFSDFENDGETLDDELTFAVSDSIDDTMTAENIVTAMLDGSMLTLTPGDASGLWQQETVTLTATDSNGKQGFAAFTVTTRANVLDVGDLTPALGFIIQGDVEGDWLGGSVSGAGDVNGDGLADLITGARFGDDGFMDAGEAYIIYGKAGSDGTQFGTVESEGTRRVVDTTDFAPDEGFIIQGDKVGDRLGVSVSRAGDVNGDGLDDLIVGAHWGIDGGNKAGEAYIIYGKAGTDGMQFGVAESGGEGRRVVDTTSLSVTDGFIIQGDREEDELGISVAGAGDINGDGIGDLIVGASMGADGDFFAGEAYIVYGKPNPPTEADAGMQFGMAESGGMRQVVDTTELSPTDGFILQGDTGGDEAGISVSGAGDVNGDGLADLIVGAYLGNDGGTNAGEAFIIYGEAGTGGTQFGTAVRIFKSDGMPVGDGTTDDTTVVRQVLDTTNLAPAAGFILQGDGAMDRLGISVSGAGDINGDGLDDLIVGAYEGEDGGADAGEAYIVYGKAGTDGTQFGAAVRLADDGTTTLADNVNPIPPTSVLRQVLDTTSLSLTDGFIIQGGAADDELGISVSGAGDVNGDGLADLIVGAEKNDDGGMDAGKAYIIYGKAGTDGTQFGSAMITGTETRQVLDTTGLAPTDGFSLQGETASDLLGGSVSGAGDVNGDGFDDLIVGADGGDDGGDMAGEAYVVYGGTQFGEVVSYAQTLTGTTTMAEAGADAAAQAAAAQAAFLLGGAGDDTLVGHADTTVLYGGAGNDVLSLADATFRRVDGGSGTDTLVLGEDVELDFTEAADRGRVRGIEAVSLSDASAMVTLDLVSVYALVESRDNGGTLTDVGEALLRLEGVSGAMVSLEGAWATVSTPNAEGTTDLLYAIGSARLLIDEGLFNPDA